MSLASPELTLIQLSDTHVCSDGELMHGVVDTFATLQSAIGAVLSSGTRVHGLLLTGDLANDGKRESYRRIANVLHPAAEVLGAQLIYVMGNHDQRPAFREELLSVSDDSGPLDSVHWIDGLRVVVLDSSTPGRPEGRIEPGQLDWLQAQLASAAPRGSILVVHHPPLPSPVVSAHLLRLRDTEGLAAALAGTDVRLILTGHTHHTGCGALAGIPVWVSPALAYRSDPLPPPNRLRGRTGAGISRIDLIGGTWVATAVDIDDSPVLYERDTEELVRYAAEKFALDG